MRLIGLTCAALVMLAACSGEPTPIEPTSTPVPTKPASSAGGTSTLEPPKLPAAAKRNDETGAANFVLYWVKASDYAALTGDTELLREVSEANCEGCRRYIDLYETTYSEGGSFSGGQHRLRNVTTESSDSATYVTADVVAAPGRYVLRHGAPEKSSAEETTKLTFLTAIRNGMWVMYDVGLASP